MINRKVGEEATATTTPMSAIFFGLIGSLLANIAFDIYKNRRQSVKRK